MLHLRTICAVLLTLTLFLTLMVGTGCETPPNSVLRMHAAEAIRDGDFARADERTSLAIAQEPSDWKALYYKGLVRIAQDRPLEARIVLEQSFEIRRGRPGFGDVADALAESYYRTKDQERLHGFLQQLTIDYGTVKDFLRQGKYLSLTGDADGAKVAFAKAVKFAPPNDPEPWKAIASFYRKLGDHNNERVAIMQLYNMNPRDPRVRDRLRELDVLSSTPGTGSTTLFGSRPEEN